MKHKITAELSKVSTYPTAVKYNCSKRVTFGQQVWIFRTQYQNPQSLTTFGSLLQRTTPIWCPRNSSSRLKTCSPIRHSILPNPWYLYNSPNLYKQEDPTSQFLVLSNWLRPWTWPRSPALTRWVVLSLHQIWKSTNLREFQPNSPHLSILRTTQVTARSH